MISIILLIPTPEAKAQLKKITMKFNYPQLDASSAMVMFFGNSDAYLSYKKWWDKQEAEGVMSKEELQVVYKTFLPVYQHATKEWRINDANVDTGLLAMNFMLVARAHGYETNPIKGYDEDKIAEVSGLIPDVYKPVMIISIGKADPNAK